MEAALRPLPIPRLVGGNRGYNHQRKTVVVTVTVGPATVVVDVLVVPGWATVVPGWVIVVPGVVTVVPG